VKPRLRGDSRAEASANLLWVLERILALTHPICPFVTEAVWEHMPGERGLLMLAPFPAADASHRDPDAERDMGRAIEIVTAVRADPAAPIEMPDGFAGAGIVARLAPKRAADGQVLDRAALERELEKLRAELRRAEGMLGNERFTSKAPPEVVAAEREKAERFAAEVSALESRLAALE
jgi:valyl-tRNA synthetase